MTTTTEPLAVLSVDGLTIPDAPKHVQRPRSIHVPAIERPAAVEQAASAHGDVLTKFADADERKRKAAKALVDARALDILTDADLVAAGDDPLPPAKRAEPKAQQALAEAERARLVATGAAARTYAKLEDAIRAELDSWLLATEAADDGAGEAYAKASRRWRKPRPGSSRRVAPFAGCARRRRAARVSCRCRRAAAASS